MKPISSQKYETDLASHHIAFDQSNSSKISERMVHPRVILDHEEFDWFKKIAVFFLHAVHVIRCRCNQVQYCRCNIAPLLYM